MRPVIAAFALLSAGCVVREVHHYHETPLGQSRAPSSHAGPPGAAFASSEPPAPRYESVTPQPADGWMWVDGFWHWDGADWLWVDGRWMPPRDGLVYVEPYYDWTGDYCVYLPGYWERPDRLPQRSVVLHASDRAHRVRIRRGARDHRGRIRDHRRADRHRSGHGSTRPHGRPVAPPARSADELFADRDRPSERVPARAEGEYHEVRRPTAVARPEPTRPLPSRTRPAGPTRLPSAGPARLPASLAGAHGPAQMPGLARPVPPATSLPGHPLPAALPTSSGAASPRPPALPGVARPPTLPGAATPPMRAHPLPATRARPGLARPGAAVGAAASRARAGARPTAGLRAGSVRGSFRGR